MVSSISFCSATQTHFFMKSYTHHKTNSWMLDWKSMHTAQFMKVSYTLCILIAERALTLEKWRKNTCWFHLFDLTQTSTHNVIAKLLFAAFDSRLTQLSFNDSWYSTVDSRQSTHTLMLVFHMPDRHKYNNFALVSTFRLATGEFHQFYIVSVVYRLT